MAPLNTKTNPVSVTLDQAADIIEQRGWANGGGGWGWDDSPDHKVCLEGGILAAMQLPSAIVNQPEYYEFKQCPAYLAVKEFLDLADHEELWRWNDRVPHRQEHVVDTLRKVAELERIKEMSA